MFRNTIYIKVNAFDLGDFSVLYVYSKMNHSTTTPRSTPEVFRHYTYTFGVLPDGTHTHDKVIQTHTIDEDEKNKVYYIHPQLYFTNEVIESATGFITKSGNRADFYEWDKTKSKRYNREKLYLIIPVFKHENEFFHLATDLTPAVRRFNEDRNICEHCNKMIIKRRGSKETKEFESRFRCGKCLENPTRDLKGTGGWKTRKMGINGVYV